MTAWGTVKVGRLTLRETWTADDKSNASTSARSIDVAGQEAMPPLTQAEVRRRSEDVLALPDRLVPVTFTEKAQYNGYYTVADAGSTVNTYPDNVETADWTLSLDRIGADGAVDLESRLANAVRLNDFGNAGERWHAPPGGAYGYFVGAATPATVVRASEDGALTVYRAIPAGINPRWACPVTAYGDGRVRLFDANGAERTGTGLALDPAAFTLSNALVRITTGAAYTLRVEAYDGAAWEAKDWNLSIGSQGVAGDEVTTWSAATVLRNDFEAVTVRLLRNLAPGRAILDLTLRRGSRFVEAYLQVATSTTLALWPAVDEAATNSGAGYLAATADDAAGNRYVAGSAHTYTARLASAGGFYRDATSTLDFFVGAAVGGGAAAAGDAPADLMAQYIGAMPETTMAVAR